MHLPVEFPPPRDWQVFEDLCRDLFAAEWGDPETKKHGRPGQADQGVDVWGQRTGEIRKEVGCQGVGQRHSSHCSQWMAVQCKKRRAWPEPKLTEAEIRQEVESAKSFRPSLNTLVIATTASEDTHFDALARELSETVGFRVRVLGWEELCRRIQSHPQVCLVWQPKLLGHPQEKVPIHLPFLPKGALLKGRDPELQALAAGLAMGSARGAFAVTQHRTEAVHGLGGVGKTALAVEHGWRWQNAYSAVFFIRSENPQLLRASLAELAPRLGFDQHEEEEVAAEAVLGWLTDRTGWLLILDNVDDEEAAEAVSALLPRLTSGRVLITSRLSNWNAGVAELPLSELTVEEGTAFLLERTRKRLSAADDASRAEKLSQRLSGLPLALEQAAAYIEVHRLSFAEYYDLLDLQSSQALAWFDSRLMSYPRSLAETWQRTFVHLGPSARAMLQIMALFEAEEIPRFLFVGERVEKVLAEAMTPLTRETVDEAGETFFSLQEAIGELNAYSLLEVAPQGFSIHRLVQEVLRSRWSEVEWEQWIGVAVDLVDAAYPGDPLEAESGDGWEKLWPHFFQLFRLAQLKGVYLPAMSSLQSRVVLYLKQNRLFSQAEASCREVPASDEE